MIDTIEVIIVTAVAGVALAALVRPYMRRPETKKGAPPCANCAASGTPSVARPTALPGRPTHK